MWLPIPAGVGSFLFGEAAGLDDRRRVGYSLRVSRRKPMINLKKLPEKLRYNLLIAEMEADANGWVYTDLRPSIVRECTYPHCNCEEHCDGAA